MVMVTPSLPAESRDILRKAGIIMKEVEQLRPAFEHHLAAVDSRFADTWTKLRYACVSSASCHCSCSNRGFELVEFNVNHPPHPKLCNLSSSDSE